jgi:hypothetical protein
MNKLYGSGANGNVLVCILEPGNVHKMIAERQPVEIDLNEGPWKGGLPAKVRVVVAYSESPIRDAKEFRELVGDPALVEDKRSPVMESKYPHCPQCFSKIEQLGIWRSEQAPVWIVFCAHCGRTLGVHEPIESLRKK